MGIVNSKDDKLSPETLLVYTVKSPSRVYPSRNSNIGTHHVCKTKILGLRRISRASLLAHYICCIVRDTSGMQNTCVGMVGEKEQLGVSDYVCRR